MSIPSTGLSRKDAVNEATKTIRDPPLAIKPLTVTVKTARQITGLGHTKIYELIKQQKLKTVTIGKRRLIFYQSLETLIQAGSSS